MVLEPQELRRYARHFSLPEVGKDGQLRLKASRVLIVGVGGLGCPAALYLAGAGVGTLGLVDPDRIDASNLHRQVLFRDGEIGLSKADIGARHLRELNPEISVQSFPVALDSSNAMDLIRGFDLVLDATDNFTTRYLVNDACFFLGKQCVFASVTRFEGRLSVFSGKGGPCYRCLFPAPPSDTVLNCAEEGILGAVPGIFGTLQALEAIKLILRMESPLRSGMLLFDLLSMQSRKISLPQNPECPLCGPRATIKNLRSAAPVCTRAPEISARELSALLDGKRGVQLIDVREPAEYDEGTLPGARSVPLQTLLNDESSMAKDKPLVVFCRSGQRSQIAAQSLLSKGFSNVQSLSGGLLGWPEPLV